MTVRRLAPALLVVALGASACGGESPTDASQDAFCDTYNSVFEDVTFADPENEPDDAEVIARLKQWADDMEETGTPEGLTEDARSGFETTVEAIRDLPDEATQEDFEEIEKNLSDAQKDAVDSFDAFASETCPAPDIELPEMPEMPDSQ